MELKTSRVDQKILSVVKLHINSEHVCFVFEFVLFPVPENSGKQKGSS